MTITVDKDTLVTLIAERSILFQHDINVQWYVMLGFVGLFVLVLAVAFHEHKKSGDADGIIGFCVLALVVTVMAWGICRVDLHFEMKQFERAPETYVIKNLR